ncbi:hypothetical protein JOM56_015200 [Amanita muscaria]
MQPQLPRCGLGFILYCMLSFPNPNYMTSLRTSSQMTTNVSATEPQRYSRTDQRILQQQPTGEVSVRALLGTTNYGIFFLLAYRTSILILFFGRGWWIARVLFCKGSDHTITKDHKKRVKTQVEHKRDPIFIVHGCLKHFHEFHQLSQQLVSKISASNPWSRWKSGNGVGVRSTTTDHSSLRGDVKNGLQGFVSWIGSGGIPATAVGHSYAEGLVTAGSGRLVLMKRTDQTRQAASAELDLQHQLVPPLRSTRMPLDGRASGRSGARGRGIGCLSTLANLMTC